MLRPLYSMRPVRHLQLSYTLLCANTYRLWVNGGIFRLERKRVRIPLKRSTRWTGDGQKSPLKETNTMLMRTVLRVKHPSVQIHRSTVPSDAHCRARHSWRPQFPCGSSALFPITRASSRSCVHPISAPLGISSVPTQSRLLFEGRKSVSMGAFASKASAEPVDSDSAPYLIVGLGNPGAKYAGNRHNVGFMAVDAFAAHHGLDFKGLQKNCHVARGVVHGSRVLLAKPMTFMNNSGEGVSQLIKYYKVPLERVIVLVDDLDTAPGKVKLKKNGGHGGQNGIRSIIDMVGSREFARVKIGIGRSAGQGDVVGWVLSDFRGEEAEALPGQLEEVRHVVEAVIKLGMEKALSGVKIGEEEERKRKREERLRRKREAAEQAAREAGAEVADAAEENEPANKRHELETN